MLNNQDSLLQTLNHHKSLLASIDQKSSILLAICSILVVAISSSLYYLEWWSYVPILLFLVFTLFLLVCSIYPRTKNSNLSTSEKNTLYFDDINKYRLRNSERISKKGLNDTDIFFFTKKLDDEFIIEQIMRTCQIIKVKYLFQKISIFTLVFAISLFTILIPISITYFS